MIGKVKGSSRRIRSLTASGSLLLKILKQTLIQTMRMLPILVRVSRAGVRKRILISVKLNALIVTNVGILPRNVGFPAKTPGRLRMRQM